MNTCINFEIQIYSLVYVSKNKVDVQQANAHNDYHLVPIERLQN